MLLNITSNDVDVLEENRYIYTNSVLLSLISQIIKQLAKVEYTNNSEENPLYYNYKSVSNKIMDETIFPIFNECVFKKYLKCLLANKSADNISETEDVFKKLENTLTENGSEIREMLNNKFNVYKIVEETINEFQKKFKGKSIKAFKSVNPIRSEYAIRKIDEFAGNNTIAELTKYKKSDN